MSDYIPKVKKKSFELYYDHSRIAIEHLGDKDLGKLFRMIVEYETDRKEPEHHQELSKDLTLLFDIFKGDLDRNYEKYVAKCEKQYKKATASHGKPRQTGEADKIREDKIREDKRGEDKSSREDDSAGNMRDVMNSVIGEMNKGEMFDE